MLRNLRLNHRIVSSKIKLEVRLLVTQTSFKVFQDDTLTDPLTKNTIWFDTIDDEWSNGKPYSEIPGPNKYTFPIQFFPGGQYHNVTLIEMHKILRKTYGDISIIKGQFGKIDNVFTFNPEDIEKVYRTEGVWPIRTGLDTFAHYRNKRADVFKGIGGLVSEQGKAWADIRNKVNPILMRTQTVRHHLTQIDKIATEFVEKIPKIRDPGTMEVPANFGDEIKKWAFESISSIALNRRLNLIQSDNPDPDVMRLAKALGLFFQLSFDFDVKPSFWKYYETKKFKTLMANYDTITDITMKFINETLPAFENNEDQNSESVLQQLLKIDKRVATVMAIDMLMAGIDTTSSGFITLLYHLAKNPDKQEKLRNELMEILPNPNTPLTKENTKNMPYLRACIKESLRIMSVTPGNFRITGQDLVLSGYQVPQGTGVIMGVTLLSNDDNYFLNSSKFIPERWLRDVNKGGCPESKSSNPFVYLPFGFGPRTCIGKRIAEMEIETLTSKIIRRYRVSWDYSPIKYISNIILIPYGDMKFKFEDLSNK